MSYNDKQDILDVLDEEGQEPPKQKKKKEKTECMEKVPDSSPKRKQFTIVEMMKTGFFVVCSSAKFLAVSHELNIQGITAKLTSNDEIAQCLEEIAHELELDSETPLDPYTKLIFLIAVTTYSQYQENSLLKRRVNKPITETVHETAHENTSTFING